MRVSSPELDLLLETYFPQRTRIVIPVDRVRDSAEYRLVVENKGNARLSLALGAEDPRETLSLDVEPMVLAVSPGTTADAHHLLDPVEQLAPLMRRLHASRLKELAVGELVGEHHLDRRGNMMRREMLRQIDNECATSTAPAD